MLARFGEQSTKSSKNRIKKYDFQENKDYFIENHRSPNLGSNQRNHQEIKWKV